MYILCRYKRGVVTVNSEKLTGTAKYLTLYTRCRINQCCYNRAQMQFLND